MFLLLLGTICVSVAGRCRLSLGLLERELQSALRIGRVLFGLGAARALGLQLLARRSERYAQLMRPNASDAIIIGRQM